MSDGRSAAKVTHETNSDFQAGFANWHEGVAAAITRAFSASDAGFEATDPRDRAVGGRPRSFAPQEDGGPRHFTPLDPDASPTQGWDPLDPSHSQPEAHGFVDPIAAAHAAGHAEGFAAGLAQAAADAGRDRAFAEALGEALNNDDRFDRDRIAKQLRQTVMLLVERMVGDIGVSGDLLAERIRSAVDLLADTAESAILRLNPADVALVEGKLPATLFPAGDATVARGSFVLESASTIVEDGPDQWLAQLTQAIDRIGVPK